MEKNTQNELFTGSVTNVELTKENLASRAEVRENSVADEQAIRVSIDRIVVLDSFNVRNEYGDIESLAKSILENGQLVPGRVFALNDGTFALTDGHRRFAAYKWLEKQGHKDLSMKVVVNLQKLSEVDRIVQMFVSQDNKHLEGYEVAELIKRLMNLGMKQNEIATKLGKTPAYISQMLDFANDSPLIKDAVKKGELTVSAAAKIKKAIPNTEKRVAAVTKAVEKKATVKGGKGTKKAVSAEEVIEEIEEPKLNDKKGANKEAVALEIATELVAMYFDELGDVDTTPMIALIKSYL